MRRRRRQVLPLTPSGVGGGELVGRQQRTDGTAIGNDAEGQRLISLRRHFVDFVVSWTDSRCQCRDRRHTTQLYKVAATAAEVCCQSVKQTDAVRDLIFKRAIDSHWRIVQTAMESCWKGWESNNAHAVILRRPLVSRCFNPIIIIIYIQCLMNWGGGTLNNSSRFPKQFGQKSTRGLPESMR